MTVTTTPCVFCEIAAHHHPSFIIYEDADCLAFLDTRPVFFGHTLFIPKPHFETFYDLSDEVLAPFFIKAKRIGKAVEKGMAAQGSLLALNNVVSQSVAHTHLHIIPRKSKDGLKGFFWPRLSYSGEAEMRETQAKIKKYL